MVFQCYFKRALSKSDMRLHRCTMCVYSYVQAKVSWKWTSDVWIGQWNIAMRSQKVRASSVVQYMVCCTTWPDASWLRPT